MSYQLMAWAAEQKTGSVTSKAVLMALANCANHQTGRCDPRIDRVAEEAEISYATAKRALDKLESAGLVEREFRHDSSGYRVGYSYTFPTFSSSSAYGSKRAIGSRPPMAHSEPAYGSQRARNKNQEGTRSTVEANASTAAGEVTSQTLLGEFVDAWRAHVPGMDLPARLKGQLAQSLKRLLDEGQSVESLRAGLGRMVERGLLQPSLLPNFVAEAALAGRAPSKRYGRRAVSAREMDAVIERLESEHGPGVLSTMGRGELAPG